MISDIISGLKFIGELFEKIAYATLKVKGTPKQRFTREFLYLYEMFLRLEECILRILTTSRRLLKSVAKNEDAYYEYQMVGKETSQLHRVCVDFLQWTDKNRKWKSTFEIFAPEIKESLETLYNADKDFVGQNDDILFAVGRLHLYFTDQNNLFSRYKVATKMLKENPPKKKYRDLISN